VVTGEHGVRRDVAQETDARLVECRGYLLHDERAEVLALKPLVAEHLVGLGNEVGDARGVLRDGAVRGERVLAERDEHLQVKPGLVVAHGAPQPVEVVAHHADAVVLVRDCGHGGHARGRVDHLAHHGFVLAQRPEQADGVGLQGHVAENGELAPQLPVEQVELGHALLVLKRLLADQLHPLLHVGVRGAVLRGLEQRVRDWFWPEGNGRSWQLAVHAGCKIMRLQDN